MADRFCRYSIGMLAAVAVFGIGPAAAQDFTAGKTPAQLFQSDCTACHKSPAGLAKGRDTRALTSFLREHYTTKVESAAALAGYLGGAGRGPAEGRAKSQAPAARAAPNPAAKPKPLQRSEGDANPNAPANVAHEERRAARPPATGHDDAKSETEEAIRKLNFYAAAGGSAYETERSADTAKKLQSYAGAGAAADTLTPADQAKPKAEKKQKKKKKSTTSASASPSASPPTAMHPPAPRRPPSTVVPRPASNN